MKNRFNVISAVAISAIALSGTAFAAEKKDAGMMQLDQKDKDFMMEAAKGGMREVDAGKMAEQKGQSAEVKMIGKTMVADHMKANNQLMALGKKKGVTIDSTHKLAKLDEKNFDKSYLETMVTDHQKTIALFEGEAKDGKDGDTKMWANKQLPTLKKHLKMVQDTQGKMKKT